MSIIPHALAHDKRVWADFELPKRLALTSPSPGRRASATSGPAGAPRSRAVTKPSFCLAPDPSVGQPWPTCIRHQRSARRVAVQGRRACEEAYTHLRKQSAMNGWVISLGKPPLSQAHPATD